MGFRNIEITQPSELHIKAGQLIITQQSQSYTIPIEDIDLIFCIGADIRISTMDLSIFSNNRIVLITLDNKYLPTSISTPYEGNARQPHIMHVQIKYPEENKQMLWKNVIHQKILNQARALAILGLPGADKVMKYSYDLIEENVDYNESAAAKEYFDHYHPGLNRRNEDPINARLNYGYSVVRSAIVRSLLIAGFHPTFGLHHDNQYNMFNMADDLIEPFRAMVDLLVYHKIDSNPVLTKTQRKTIVSILNHACMVDDKKISISSAIDEVCESLRRCYLEEDVSLLKLPTVIELEEINPIGE